MANIIKIDGLSTEVSDIYNKLNENGLKRLFEPELGLFIAESVKVIDRALEAGFRPISALVEEKVLEREFGDILPRLGNIPVYEANEAVLSQITGYKLTRGALCAMVRKELPTVQEICQNAKRIAVLEDVENPTNMGAIFRSAAALDIDCILLSRGCSDPLYRRSIRVSMGTVFQIPWTYYGEKESDWYENGIYFLKDIGFKTAAMALTENSTGIDDPILKEQEKIAIILGTEGEGLRNSTINNSDYVLKIPMANGVDSLNVAAASAVIFWELAAR